MTPYYDESGITIYHGDCREVLPTLPICDLLATDIPYGEVNRASGGLRDLDKRDADIETFDISEIAPLFAKRTSGSAYVWCGSKHIASLRSAFECAGMTTRLGVWEKTDPSPMNGEYIWLSSLEFFIFGRYPKAVFTERCKSPVFRGPCDREVSSHPTPKPLWLMNRLILASTNDGGLVTDPCCGSGSTLRAAKDQGRRAIGIEINERYCEIAANRLRQGVLFPAGAT